MNRRDALHGALVADAAAMGLHWMYDHQQLDTIEATGDLMFRQPDANVYEGQKAYFAHAAKRCGEYSQYGESARVVAQVIAVNSGYDPATHRKKFFETFGPCGSYHGFADRPTKALVAKMIMEGDKIPDQSGSDDDQLPALCAVPAMFYHQCGEDELKAAVSVTTINDVANEGALVLYSCLQLLATGSPLQLALRQAADRAGGELSALLHEAINYEAYDPRAVADHFGLPCHMTQGLPVAWHLLRHASDYVSVVRDNIRCGGDCCGRSMAVGSVAGLAYGVPMEMKLKVGDSSLLI